LTKKKVPWWLVPQEDLDKILEYGRDPTKIEWYVEVDDKGKRSYGVVS